MSMRDILEAIEVGNSNRLTVLLQKCPEDLKAELKDTRRWLDWKSSPIHSAVHFNRTEELLQLAEFGVKVNCSVRSNLGDAAQSGETPLHIAVLKEDVELLKSLLRLGADYTAISHKRTEDGRVLEGTPREWASQLRSKSTMIIFQQMESADDQRIMLCKILIVIFVFMPLASFIFFSTLKRYREG